jgi:hypothetical protein
MDLIDEAFVLADLAQAAHLRALSKGIRARVYTKLEQLDKAAASFEATR